MAGYSALVSLKQTIERILASPRFRLVSSSRKILHLANSWELGPLIETMKRLDRSSKIKSRKKVNALDGRIKEAVWRFEDLLESHLCDQFNLDALVISIDLESLQSNIDSFILVLKDLKEEYIYELRNMPEVEEDEYASSRYDFGGMNKAEMVGFSDLFERVKEYFEVWEDLDDEEDSFFSLVGMPGSGKTTLAKTIFEDPDVSRWYQHRAWITVGRRYELNEIAGRILAQLDLDNIINVSNSSKRCLIVLDDVWDEDVVVSLKSCLLDKGTTTVQILITSTQEDVSSQLRESRVYGAGLIRGMKHLDEKESKELLRRLLFSDEDFPAQLQKAAEKIAKNCEGHPLMIVTVAHLISKDNRKEDPKFWNKVAEHRNSGLMMDAHDQISKVLFPVYDCFTQCYKMVYLYMGAFPRDYDIPASKLRSLFAAEGLVQREEFHEIMGNFSGNVMNHGVTSLNNSPSGHYRSFKTCRLNSSWRYMLNKEASKNKFLCVLNSDEVVDGLQGQRRLCLHTNFLLSFEDVYDSVKECASTARSLLCFGPYHPYSMPLDVGFKLLRVLDALRVRFYVFPVEILELVLLQYLALTCNGELPTTISKLINLQFLIIHPHVSIKSCRGEYSSNVPVQIWDMQELKHIEVMGSNLPKPNSSASLQKLSTLLGVSTDSCTHEVFRKLPDITKLGIQIELTPESEVSSPLGILSCFAEVEKLDTLKCVVVNPELKYGCVSILNALSMVQSSLRKLHLSGMGCPWEDMEVIGSMPHLKNLKLRCYAFRGPKWEIKCGGFLSLEYLIVEDTDLVQWEPGHGCFPKLSRLSMKHCYKLKELCWPYDARSGRIEMVDCNPLAVTCARQLKPANEGCGIRFSASFEGEEL